MEINNQITGVWHQTKPLNFTAKHMIIFYIGINVVLILPCIFISYIFELHGDMSIKENLIRIILILPITTAILGGSLYFWVNNYIIPTMLKFDGTGIEIKMKSGKIITANWNQIEYIKFNEQQGAITIGLKGRYYSYAAYLSIDLGKALDDKFKSRSLI